MTIKKVFLWKILNSNFNVAASDQKYAENPIYNKSKTKDYSLKPKKWIPTYNIALQSFYFSL